MGVLTHGCVKNTPPASNTHTVKSNMEARDAASVWQPAAVVECVWWFTMVNCLNTHTGTGDPVSVTITYSSDTLTISRRWNCLEPYLAERENCQEQVYCPDLKTFLHNQLMLPLIITSAQRQREACWDLRGFQMESAHTFTTFKVPLHFKGTCRKTKYLSHT